MSRRYVAVAAALAATAAVVTGALIPGDATADPDAVSVDRDVPGAKPTIVLVHGAFTDASSWNGVTTNLHHAGYRVVAPANPLRDLASDAASVAAVVKSIDGPVILAGHSYGGEVITNAAREADNVAGLVYVAGFAPDSGESAATISARYPETPLKSSLTPLPHPDGTVDLSIAPQRFHEVFAQDVPGDRAALMAVAQRPMTEAAFEAPSGAPAWRDLPSWFVIPTEDHALHPDAQVDMAARADSRETVRLDSGHAVPVSHPDEVAGLIRTAARQAGGDH